MNNIITFSSQQFKHYLKNNQVFYNFLQIPAGKILVLFTHNGIFNATFDETMFDHAMANYTHKEIPNNPCLILYGTSFQISVWQALLKISIGTTTHYQAIAQMVSHPTAWRAAANAIANNNLAYFVPCHRVIHKNGSSAGYRWGIEKKMILLNTEKK